MGKLEQEMAAANLTEDQKKQMYKIRKAAIIRGGLIGFRLGMLFLFTNVLIGLLNAGLVHNQAFATIAGVINGFFLANYFINSIKENRQIVEAQISEVLKK